MDERTHEDLTHEDFEAMTLAEIERLTGVPVPGQGADPDSLSAYRERAYRSYMLDRENRAEWGTAAQATEPPHESDDGD